MPTVKSICAKITKRKWVCSLWYIWHLSHTRQLRTNR